MALDHCKAAALRGTRYKEGKGPDNSRRGVPGTAEA